MSDILVIAEHRRGELRGVSGELITAARELTNDLGGQLHMAVISGDIDRFATELNRDGVDVIHTVERGDDFNHGLYTAAIESLYETIQPTGLVMPHTIDGRDYAPAVASKLDIPLVTDAIELDAEDGLSVTRKMFGSKVETVIDVDDDQWAVTLRSGEWLVTRGDGTAEVRSHEFDIDSEVLGTQAREFVDVETGEIEITDADVLVSVGRGIESEEHIGMIRDLAETIDATVAASRPVVDNGWLPKSRQVGQSGKVVTPDVYIAVGISGAVQHTTGMKDADTVVAINDDPTAPIFDIADYGITDDLFDVVPALTEEFAG